MRARVGEKEMLEFRRAGALNALQERQPRLGASRPGMSARKGAHVRSLPRFAEATCPAEADTRCEEPALTQGVLTYRVVVAEIDRRRRVIADSDFGRGM
jgi:hypothetical protein